MIRQREDGRAVVEFVFLGVLMLLPLLYLVLTAARLQAASFAASLASREAGRAFVTGRDEVDALDRAHAAADLAFADFAFDRGTNLEVSCDGSPCLRPEGSVSVRTSIAVELPLIPDFIAGRVPSAVTVTSTHLQSVDRFVAR
jgi:hypothetical protein